MNIFELLQLPKTSKKKSCIIFNNNVYKLNNISICVFKIKIYKIINKFVVLNHENIKINMSC